MTSTDLAMYRGDDRSLTIEVTGADVTGADVTFSARDRPTDSTAVIELTTDDGGVEIVDATHIRVNIPRAATVGFHGDRWLVWDLQITLNGEVRTLPDPSPGRVTLGTLFVRADVTH